MTYVPNLTSLNQTYTQSTANSILAVGCSEYDVPGRSLRRLPGAEAEAADVAALYPESTLLLGAMASVENVVSLEQEGVLARHPIIHLATHGDNVHSDSPMESLLYLHDGVLEGIEISQWRLNAQTVVLSACSAGQRSIAGRGMDELPGDDLLGLTGALFAAGAQQVLAPLWPVSDWYARVLTEQFHRGVAGGLAPEVALQKAMCRLRDEADDMVFHWAPFCLTALGRPEQSDIDGRDH